MNFQTELLQIVKDVEPILEEYLPPGLPGSAADVGRYAVLDAGKRLRVFLTVKIAELFGVSYESAIRAGAVIEIVHAFSLVHDDLPCIDNDELRRGKPSAWAKFGERNAVLGGDYLLNIAYKILAEDERISPDVAVRLKLAGALADATDGMILGEWMDCEAESGRFNTIAEVEKIQTLKTGKIFMACANFGMILGNADNEARAAIEKFIAAMGLCFQITDDILDCTSTAEQLGKTPGKDRTANKATYISLSGLENARAKVLELAADAKSALNIFGERAEILSAFMDYMVKRNS